MERLAPTPRLLAARAALAPPPAAAASGCTDEAAAAAREIEPVAEQRRTLAVAAIEAARDLPPAPDTYREWRDGRDELERLDTLVEALEDELGDAMESISADREQMHERVERLRVELGFDAEPVPDFRFDGEPNAVVLLLGPDGDEAALRDRNYGAANLLLGHLGAESSADRLERYERLVALEYVLVLREVELVAPEYEGREGESEQYSTGGMVCDASLHRVDDGEVLCAFRVASGSHSPTVVMGYDILLSDDPEIALSTLERRLHSTARDHAPAALAEIHDGVESDYQVVNTYFGDELVRNAD